MPTLKIHIMKQKYTLLVLFIFSICIPVLGNNLIPVNNLQEFGQGGIKIENQDTNPKPVTRAELIALYKKQRKELEDFGKEGILKLQESSRDPIQKARVIEFDAKKSNIERFSKSPCWKKLGYTLYESYDIQDARYKACESKYYKNRTQKGLTYFLILVMIIVISLLLIKERKFIQPNSEV